MVIQDVVDDIAAKIGLSGLTVSLGKKCQLNKIAVHTLCISTQDKKIDTLVTHEEIASLTHNEITGHLKIRVEISLRSLLL